LALHSSKRKRNRKDLDAEGIAEGPEQPGQGNRKENGASISDLGNCGFIAEC